MAESGRARISIAADDRTAPAFNSVRARFGALQSDVQGLGASFTGVGATLGTVLGGFGLGALVRGVADGIDKLNDLADATGSSVENLSGLEALALRTGTSFETVSAALLKFNQALNSGDNGDVAEVLKAIGLSAQDLRKQDPAQALLTTAKALEQFAADGNRARAEQLLFGRSLRDVAPLLRDLAEAGQLNATVTTEQAQAAEQFNRNLAAVRSSAVEAGRAIFNEAVPVLNELGKGFSSAASEGERFSGVAAAVRAVVETLTVVGAYVVDTFSGVGREIGAIAAQIVALGTLDIKGFNAISQALKEDNERAKAELDKFVSRVLAAGKAAGVEGGRGLVNPPNVGGQSIGAIGGAGRGVREQASEYEKYIDKLREALRGTQELTAAEQIRVDIAEGKLGRLTDAQREYAYELARVLDLAKQPAALVGPEISEELLRQRKAALAEVKALADASPAGQFDELVRKTQATIEAFRQGQISAQDYGRALETLGKGFEDLQPKMEEVSGFAQQASRNIQDALGDSVLAAIENDGKRIEDVWKSLIKRLVAQAAAAELGKALFGDGYGTKTNQVGGLIGQLGTYLGGLFGGPRASGGPVQPGRAYLVGEQGRELFVPEQAGTVVPNNALQAGGGATTFVMNVQGSVSEDAERVVRAMFAQYEARRMSAWRG